MVDSLNQWVYVLYVQGALHIKASAAELSVRIMTSQATAAFRLIILYFQADAFSTLFKFAGSLLTFALQ